MEKKPLLSNELMKNVLMGYLKGTMVKAKSLYTSAWIALVGSFTTKHIDFTLLTFNYL